ncbi:MAG: hypothetical protein RIC19_18165 [Phaeodactylibacter sp.]|uniref:hypothetical protein n=1 Tax=Phaeodactylibacter sp. TaxID=1940289 RepID=UPI0032EC8CDC
MQHPQLSPDTLEQMLLAELENTWQEVDELIREQEQSKLPTAIIRQFHPKPYIWNRASRYCKRISANLYRLWKTDLRY